MAAPIVLYLFPRRAFGPAPHRSARRIAAACATVLACALPIAGCAEAPEVAGAHLASDAAGVLCSEKLPGLFAQASGLVEESLAPSEEELRAEIDLVEDYRDEFSHGPKGSEYQRYIVLHDTEGAGTPESVVSYWDGADNGVAAHFVIGKDGHVVQCVPLDEIAHHAGFGDTGHNEFYGTTDESRDDRVGTTEIGSWASDYGMNSYSIGIELVHRGGEGDYPQAQLEALDRVIALIDAHYGFESEIIDHKAWRTGNSDTSAEFAGYLANYQDHRSYRDETGE